MNSEMPSLRNRDRLRAALRATVGANKRVTTKWSVVTGPPASGKSTLIAQLSNLGHQVVTDPAREVLQQRIQRGRSKTEARSDYLALQAEILERMLADAQALNPAQSVVFDYALPDNLAFLTISGAEWTDEHVRAACYYRYQNVFLLDPVDRCDDGPDTVRIETKEERWAIHALLQEIYEELDIPITRLAPIDLRQRLDVVVRSLAEWQRKEAGAR